MPRGWLAAAVPLVAIALAVLDARAQPAAEQHTAPEPQSGEPYRCEQPQMEIPRSAACERGASYPQCKWQIPNMRRREPGLYAIWRNTVPGARWGRPGLVSLLLATAAEYSRRWSRERLTIGDLDAPGPRHVTHGRGVDADVYLTDAMMTRNAGGGRYVDNYARRSTEDVTRLRAKVMDLARILATCTRGQLRIYYNDPEIVRPFVAWFEASGLHSDVGTPMRRHNELHEFHFHVTVSENQAVLPASDASEHRRAD